MDILEIHSMTFCNEDRSAFNALVRVPHCNGFINITCSKFSKEAEYRQFYQEAIQGLHGEIKPYVKEDILTEYDLKCKEVRDQRDALLLKSDSLIIRAIEQNKQPSQEAISYRQRLRDVPLQSGFPYEIFWPTLN